MVIRYDLIAAHEAGVISHPQTFIKDAGFTVKQFEGCPIADCIFMEIEPYSKNLLHLSFIDESNWKFTLSHPTNAQTPDS